MSGIQDTFVDSRHPINDRCVEPMNNGEPCGQTISFHTTDDCHHEFKSPRPDSTKATLVERLRNDWGKGYGDMSKVSLEAADALEAKDAEIERLRAARKDDGELIKSLRHRLRSGLPYGDPHACPTSCNTSFCGRGGCRFTNG